MKNLSTFLLAMLLVISVQAQYKRPYRIAYHKSKKSYLITNRGDGSVLELDAKYKVTKVVTGLTDPRDLVVGTVSGNEGLLVVDNNELVVYDASSYSKLTTFKIPGAGEIEDIAIDPSNPGYFYLSDVKNNKIIKGKVGPPPFFTPSYSTLVSSGVNRPKGLYFNNKNELLVLTDEKNGKVVRVDTANGTTRTMLTPGLDSLNSITQDGEGNYFFTNWGDSYLYRCSSSFQDVTKLTSYNKPGGLVTNPTSDLLIVLCHLCNKIEYHKLHYFDLNGTAGACAGDSLTVDLAINANGIGTYNAGNRFEVELSDSIGSFTNPLVIGKVNATSKPDQIECKLPSGIYGSNHKYRIRSTNPQFYSSEMAFTAYSTPDMSGITKYWALCKGSTVNLGRSGFTGESYTWTSGRHLNDSTVSNPVFSAADTGSFKYGFKATNVMYGCSDSVQVDIDVNPDIQLKNLNRKIELCSGDSVQIGVSSPYNFKWSPAVGLDRDTVLMPWFSDTASRTYTVDMKDPVTGCTGKDSVSVIVNELPEVEITKPFLSLCEGLSGDFGVVKKGLHQYRWSSGAYLSDSTMANPTYTSMSPGVDTLRLSVTNQYDCASYATVLVSNNPKPVIKLTNAFCKNGINTRLFLEGDYTEGVSLSLNLHNPDDNSSWLFGPIDSLPLSELVIPDQNGFGKGWEVFVTGRSDSGCTGVSNKLIITFLSLPGDIRIPGVKLYPNPASGSITISSEEVAFMDVRLYTTEGKMLLVGTKKSGYTMDVSRLSAGVYVVVAQDNIGRSYRQQILIRR